MLSRRIDSCSDRLEYFDSEAFHLPLAALQIYFEPVDFEDPNRVKPKLPDSTPLTRILQMITSKLLPLVERLERLKVSF